jgi:hypothetical protein
MVAHTKFKQVRAPTTTHGKSLTFVFGGCIISEYARGRTLGRIELLFGGCEMVALI